MMKILMVASENDALPGGKVGGIGDVLRDIPKALACAGQQLDVVLPGYGSFSTLPYAQCVSRLSVAFAGQEQDVGLYRVDLPNRLDGVTQWVLEHPLFAQGGVGEIYCDDPPDRPFASDASKFALFCAAVAKAIVNGEFGQVDRLHLHDWHSALLTVLRAFDPQFKALQEIPCIYTIHNLALQGIRPLKGDESSLQQWFGTLKVEHNAVIDPRYPDCINPMRCGINLSDKVHVVSDTYAHEILLPSDTEQGYFGGEGLELDLQRARDEGRLHGILNGCEYEHFEQKQVSMTQLLEHIEDQLLIWTARHEMVKSAHMIALARVARWLKSSNVQGQLLLTSVGRLTEQKASLLQFSFADGVSALERSLDQIGESGRFILLGSGDKRLEGFMTEIAAKRSNFLFLNGYSQALADMLYAGGDLFIMPSSFEPCGISQMLAMRSHQPCLVHQVGGLNDTVKHMENGFGFNGKGQMEQAQNMVDCLSQALALKCNEPQRFDDLSHCAGQARFLWSDSARQYIEKLYG